jgi:hypothetical protein
VVDPQDYITGRDLSQINNVDAVINSFFVYCHFAGSKLCPFYTGTTIGDISSRFENLFVPLNLTYAAAQNWTNATVIMESLLIIKANIRGAVYSPISDFPPLAQQLVAYESALRNLTVQAVEAASSTGVVTINVPGTIVAPPEWQPAVLCPEIPSLYNQTYADLSSFIRELEKQSFIAGELWASIAVVCARWPIRAASRFAGELPISRSFSSHDLMRVKVPLVARPRTPYCSSVILLTRQHRLSIARHGLPNSQVPKFSPSTVLA